LHLQDGVLFGANGFGYLRAPVSKQQESVGFMTAVMGIARLLASIPTGYLSNVYRREMMLKIASLIGLEAIAVTLLAVYHTPRRYTFLLLAMGDWGTLWRIANTALGALFAAIIADGDRSYYFTKRFILINLGNTTGPAFALATFALLGDHWTVIDCAIVMTLGQIVCLPAIFLLTLFNDHDVPTSTHEPEQSEPRQYVEFENPEDSLGINATEPLLPENPVQSNGRCLF
jgi:MFS family permease